MITVAQAIAILQGMPQDAPLAIFARDFTVDATSIVEGNAPIYDATQLGDWHAIRCDDGTLYSGPYVLIE